MIVHRFPSRREHTEPRREPAADPLTELARLIGQEDPFGDFYPRPRRRSIPEDPLAELARLVSREDPFAEFLDLQPTAIVHEPLPPIPHIRLTLQTGRRPVQEVPYPRHRARVKLDDVPQIIMDLGQRIDLWRRMKAFE